MFKRHKYPQSLTKRNHRIQRAHVASMLQQTNRRIIVALQQNYCGEYVHATA